MSIDITHLENKPEVDDVSSDSVEEVSKPKTHKSTNANNSDNLSEHDDNTPTELTDLEKKEEEFLRTVLELYKVSFPKLKGFDINENTNLQDLRSIKKSCDAQLSVGPAIGTYEQTFYQFLTGIEMFFTKNGYDLSGFSYICQQDEAIKQDLRLVVIKLAAHFSPRPEFRLLMNVARVGGGVYYVNLLKSQEQNATQQQNNQSTQVPVIQEQPVNNSIIAQGPVNPPQ